MSVSINMPAAPRSTPIEGILNALQIAHEYYGIKSAKTAAEALQNKTQADAAKMKAETQSIEEKQDPNSQVSQRARAEEQAAVDYLGRHGAIDKPTHSAFLQSLQGSPVGPMNEGQERQGPMTAAQLEKDPNFSPLLQMFKGQQQADAMGNKFGSINDTKKEMQQNTIHQQVLGKLTKDPTLSKTLVQYQNLDNALSLLTKSDHVTPQQFDEFQQSVRGNLGIKGSSGVDERSHTYLNSIGLNADRFNQILTGKPASMDPNDPFLKHVKQLAAIEQNNIAGQTQKRMNTLTAGNGWMYDQRPDLKEGLAQAIGAVGSQYKSQAQEPTQVAANGMPTPSHSGEGGSPFPGSSAQAKGGMPSMADIQSEMARRQALRNQGQ